jgi:phosphoglucomutase
MAISLKRLPLTTSGHHGSALHCRLNEAHALSLTQAMCDYRARQGIYGPVFLGVDTNAQSTRAFAAALEVLGANGVEVMVTSNGEHVPVRAVSSAILTYNRGRANGLADGIVIALSHERPEAGAFIYILPDGGCPDIHATRWIDTAAKEYLRWGPSSVRRLTYEEERGAARSLPDSLGASCGLR